MIIYVSGGCKNGKSSHAEDWAIRLSGGKPLYYIATMIPHDDEDRARIRRHIESRAGKNFITIERGRDIAGVIPELDTGGTYLMDSITALLGNEMFHDGIIDADAAERTVRDLKALAGSVANIVFVSDFIYADQGLYDEFTDGYLQGLAHIDRSMAEIADCVVEIVLAQPIIYKGSLPE